MEALNPQTPEEIRRDLLEAWNPRGAGSTVGTEYERLIILPLANRMALVKVNKIASALLLEEWQAARSLIDGLSQAEARACTLRGSVLAAKTIRDAKAEGTDATFDGEVDLRWRAATLRLREEAGVAMGYSANAFHEGVDRLLDHCPDLASGNVVILDMISRLLAPLSADAGRGAAFAGSALFVGSLLVSDFRTRRDLAREQLALVIAFTHGDVISCSDGHIRSSS